MSKRPERGDPRPGRLERLKARLWADAARSEYRPLPALRYAAYLLVETLHRFNQNKGWSRSAALAYEFTVALVPLFLISFTFFAATPGLASYQDKVQAFVLEHLLPSSADVLSRHLDAFRLNAQAISIVGFLVLALTAVALLVTVESVINDIWKVPVRRTLAARTLAVSSAIVWGPVLIGFSYYLSLRFKEFADRDGLLHVELVTFATRYLVPFLITSAAFGLIYYSFPNTKVRVRCALGGAVVGAVLWEGSKHVFDIYFRHVVTYNVIFGSLGAVPVFLTWIYLSWSILIFGVEATFVLQNFHDLSRSDRNESRGQSAPPYLAARCAMRIGRAFAFAEPAPAVDDLADRFAVPEYAVREELVKLQQAGLVVKVDGEDRFALARAPERIDLIELLEAVGTRRPDLREFEDDEAKAYFEKLFDTLDSQARETLAGVTLARLVQEIEKK